MNPEIIAALAALAGAVVGYLIGLYDGTRIPE